MAGAAGARPGGEGTVPKTVPLAHEMPRSAERRGTLFLCGDVMSGRGIDQIHPHRSRPEIVEAYVRSALDHVGLAERAAGRIARPVDDAYVGGDAIAEFERVRPDVRIVNLETAVTASDEPWPAKGIQYRMHPANVPCLTAARLDCCVVANNHVMDWGRAGLADPLQTLHNAGIRTAGAGRDAGEAATPASIELPGGGRLLVFAVATEEAGVPADWAATGDRSGVNPLRDLSPRSTDAVARQVAAAARSCSQAGTSNCLPV